MASFEFRRGRILLIRRVASNPQIRTRYTTFSDDCQELWVHCTELRIVRILGDFDVVIAVLLGTAVDMLKLEQI